MIGYVSLAESLAQAVIERNPAFAHALAPWDGRATAAFAASLAGANASPGDRKRADELARRALLRDATAVAAASTLGIDAQIRSDTAAARRSFAYSEKLSRRDLQTQLWNIETAVADNDIRAALHHYDIALRTKGQSWDLLFPILASASADPQVREHLIRTLAGRPLWAEAFINHVASSPPDPQSVSTLFLELRRAGVPVPDGAHAGAISALLEGGFAQQAWHHYVATHQGADPRRSRDPRFLGAGETPTPFDWVLINDGSMNSSIQRSENGGLFDFAVPASNGGPLLMQVQVLPPGDYRLLGHSSGIEQAAGSQPYWAMQCRTDGHELARVVVPNSSQTDGHFQGQITVPPGCPVQVLVLVARASDAVSGLTGQIDHLELVPAT